VSAPIAEADAVAAAARRAASDAAIHRSELVISTMLRVGVGLSVALVLLGTIVTFVHHPSYLTSNTDLATLKTTDAFPTTIPAVIHGLAAFEGRAIVMLGLVVLVATPIMRVAVSIVTFAQQRDHAFVAITSVVLLLLLVSLGLGKAGG
jgi:uncharacterized membrane protein